MYIHNKRFIDILLQNTVKFFYLCFQTLCPCYRIVKRDHSNKEYTGLDLLSWQDVEVGQYMNLMNLGNIVKSILYDQVMYTLVIVSDSSASSTT